MANASRDENDVPSLLGVSASDGRTVVPIYADPDTHALYVTGSGGSGLNKLDLISGDVDGSNTDFEFSGSPTLVVVDGLTMQKTTVNGVENWIVTGTNQIKLSAAPTLDIIGLG